MRRVIIESPYGDKNIKIIARNERYARRALHDCLSRGEAPLASHLLYTQVLCDEGMADRELGIKAGLAWYTSADASVVYKDHGISPGMHKGIKKAESFGLRVEFREIGKEAVI